MPYLGSPFIVHVGDGRTVSVELSEVASYPAMRGAPRQEPFALVFAGPSETPFAQGLYALDHPELGRLEIFLVPIGPGPDGRHRYEAVFN